MSTKLQTVSELTARTMHRWGPVRVRIQDFLHVTFKRLFWE